MILTAVDTQGIRHRIHAGVKIAGLFADCGKIMGYPTDEVDLLVTCLECLEGKSWGWTDIERLYREAEAEKGRK